MSRKAQRGRDEKGKGGRRMKGYYRDPTADEAIGRVDRELRRREKRERYLARQAENEERRLPMRAAEREAEAAGREASPDAVPPACGPLPRPGAA